MNELLGRCAGGPVDVATAYFAVSGYRLVREQIYIKALYEYFREELGAELICFEDVTG